MAGLRDALFGSMAVRAGLVTDDQVREGLELQSAERRAGRQVPKLGEILVARKYLKPEQIQAILDGQASLAGGKFGEIAVRLKLCPQEAVEAALRAQQDRQKADRRIGELLVEAGALRSHHVVAVLECQGLSLESCPGCGQAVNLAKGAAGARCPGCSTLLSPQAAVEAAEVPGPLPEAPEASPDDSGQVAAAVASAAQAAAFGGYQVLARLGVNASGGLYLARKGAGEALVTLKIFNPERARAKGFAESFAAAAKAGAKLQHPGVNRVLAAGRDRGRVYCASEYVAGQSLRHLLDKGKPLEVERALRIARQLAEALGFAHAQGLIHGEVKPSNIIVTATGSVKIANFGVAGNPLQNLLVLARAAGSAPIYAAPELAIKDAQPTVRSDVYSLGATLYHLLTGRPPYQGKSPLEVLLRVAQEEPVAPSKLRREIVPELDDVVMHMLAPEPEERPADMAAVLRELEQFLPGAGRDPAAGAERGAEEPVAGAEVVSDAAAVARRRKLLGLLTALIILFVFVVAALAIAVMAPAIPREPTVSKLPTPPPVPTKTDTPQPRPPLTRPPPEPEPAPAPAPAPAPTPAPAPVPAPVPAPAPAPADPAAT